MSTKSHSIRGLHQRDLATLVVYINIQKRRPFLLPFVCFGSENRGDDGIMRDRSMSDPSVYDNTIYLNLREMPSILEMH